MYPQRSKISKPRVPFVPPQLITRDPAGINEESPLRIIALEAEGREGVCLDSSDGAGYESLILRTFGSQATACNSMQRTALRRGGGRREAAR